MPEFDVGDQVRVLRKPGFAHAYNKIGTVVDYDGETPLLYSRYLVEVPRSDGAPGTTLVPVAGHELRPAPSPELVPVDAALVAGVLAAAGLRRKYQRPNALNAPHWYGFEVSQHDETCVEVHWHASTITSVTVRLGRCARVLEAAGFTVTRLGERLGGFLAVVRSTQGDVSRDGLEPAAEVAKGAA